jgi:predicted nucleotidyltransferase
MAEDKDYSQYHEGMRRLGREWLERFERERVELLEKVRPAGAALRALGAREVILFGSILRPGYFDRASDIDILIVDLPEEFTWKALKIVEDATGIWDRDLNLVFSEMAGSSLIDEARRAGIIL